MDAELQMHIRLRAYGGVMSH